MSAMQRRKGKAGEQELARLLREHLGIEVSRNLLQAREGGADLLGVLGWAIEVKRAVRPSLASWWQQTCRQAEDAGERPVLAYRLDRHPWRFVLALRHVAHGFEHAPLSMQVETDLEVFAALVREGVDGTEPHL